MSDTDHGATAPSVVAPKLAGALSLVPKPTGPAPAHARDPRGSKIIEDQGTHVCVDSAAMFDILDQLKKLAPCHKDPQRFHERKDELVGRLFNMAIA